MAVVATFNDAENAARAKGWLEKGGFHAATFDESKLQKFWFLCRPLANHRVCVRPEDASRARQLLQTPDQQESVLQGEICCLQCGSPRVEYPQFTRKFITTTFVELGCLLGITERMFYCLDCHHSWPSVERLRPITDSLNWPMRKHHRLVKKEGPWSGV